MEAERPKKDGSVNLWNLLSVRPSVGIPLLHVHTLLNFICKEKQLK